MYCRRGRGDSSSRWQFEARLEHHLIRLADELRSRRYRPSPSVCFVSDQPKRREIFAAAFRDRVVHHLLVRQLEPYWESRFIHDSFACRRGKGTLAAVDRSQQYIRQVSGNGSGRAWALHLDVRSFFVSIDKNILLSILERGIVRQGLPWADELAWLTRQIVLRDPSVDALRIGRGFAAIPPHKSLFHTGNVCGLPIGNFSSQFFANVYLDRLDQFVKHELKVRHYLRYVDDLLLFDRDRDRLQQAEGEIDAFLRRELKLELHPARRVLVPTSNGVHALGHIVYHDHRLLRRRTLRRFERRLRAAEAVILDQRGGGQRLHLHPGHAQRLLACAMSYRGLLRQGNYWRQSERLQRRFPWVAQLWHLSLRGRVRCGFRIDGTPARLAVQWRAFKQRWPRARMLIQLGDFWEAFRGDAKWLRDALSLGPGRRRPGLGGGAGFRVGARTLLRRLQDTSSEPWLLVRQTGRCQGALREREIAILWLPIGCVQMPKTENWLLVPRAPQRPHHAAEHRRRTSSNKGSK